MGYRKSDRQKELEAKAIRDRFARYLDGERKSSRNKWNPVWLVFVFAALFLAFGQFLHLVW